MKKVAMHPLLLIIYFITSIHLVSADVPETLRTSPYFFTRSQSRNKVLQDVGSAVYAYNYAGDYVWGFSDVVLAYERSFKPGRIIDCIFGNSLVATNSLQCNSNCTINDNCNGGRTFTVQGSQVINRNPNAWLADYFYLPVDFDSTISFNPHITNVLIFLDQYIGFDQWVCGLYLRLYAPIVHTRWNLNFCETVTQPGTTAYPAGYFGALGQPSNGLLQRFSDYAAGLIPNASSLRNAGVIVGGGAADIILNPLNYAQMDRLSKNRTGVADLRMELGWNFWQTSCYHLGINAQGAAPTGNAPHARFLFDPLIGNGKHWEFGFGLTGHYLFWVNEAENCSFGLYADANITHLFASRQQRAFDLLNKPNSRYMLAEKMGTPVLGLFGNAMPNGVPGGIAPSFQFQNEFSPVVNLTTTDINVSIGAQADIVAWFNYTFCDWSFDLGYNFWGTTCENLGLDGCNTCRNPLALCNTNSVNTWGLKGDARVYGFVGAAATALSATESLATINSGTNMIKNVSTPNDPFYKNNSGVDNPQFAQATSIATPLTTSPAPAISDQVQTSHDPIVLTCNDIDFIGHQGISHKIFGNIQYSWYSDCWMPFFCFGWSAEFAQKNSTQCNTSCKSKNDCMRCAPSLWSVWLKGGVVFD